MPKSCLTLIFTLILSTSSLSVAGTKAAAGLELGGNGTFMFSDPSVQIFAAGAGLQGSLYYSMWNDRPIGGKLRYEIVALQEGALQKSATNYIQNGTSLRSMSQSWSLISVGAEGRFTSQNQSMFWEGLLGYAIAGGGSMNVSLTTQDQPIYGTAQSVSSAMVITGGAGIKRIFSNRITGIISLRTFFLLSPIYSSVALNQKTLIPLPFLFNIGVEMPFEF